jgi:anthranilate phosphoribosyltransferase
MSDADTVLRDALDQLVVGHDLDTATARAVMDRVMEGGATAAQIGAILAALRAKGESVEELTGMALSMRDHAVRVDLDVDAVDTCGTGGDRSGTFNISTAAAFVVAGAGQPVAKHGNRAASSRCGSADVLEALGVAIQIPPEGVKRCVEEAGIGFLFAPAFHPAMRHAAAVRSELGIRTVFNILGPLANPARVRLQALGVGDARLAPSMAAVLQQMGHRHALVMAGAGGLDELGLDAPSQCHEVSPGAIKELEVDPAELGLKPAPVSALRGGDAAENARAIRDVLSGADEGPRGDVVLLNAAAALLASDRAVDLVDGLAQARESVATGAATARLEALIRLSAEAVA